MPRPEHPGVPLPASCIRDLQMRQNLYDENPEKYEQQEKERAEERQIEEEERCRWEMEQQAQVEAEAAQAETDDLPF